MGKRRGDVKAVIPWSPVFLLVVAITYGMFDPFKVSTSANLIQWILFFAIGIQNIWAAIASTVYAESTAASMGWKSGPFQFKVAFANFGIGIAALLAPWFGHEYWLAVIIIVAGFCWGTAYCHTREILVKKNFSPSVAGPGLYTDIFIPLLLIVLYFLFISSQ